jgi:hypothetical protein
MDRTAFCIPRVGARVEDRRVPPVRGAMGTPTRSTQWRGNGDPPLEGRSTGRDGMSIGEGGPKSRGGTEASPPHSHSMGRESRQAGSTVTKVARGKMQ